MSTIKKNKNIIHLLISCFIILMFWHVIPPFGQVTEIGMHVAGVFIGVLYGWITIGIMLPSLLGLCVLGLTGAIDVTTLFQQGFGNQITILTIFMLFVAAAIEELKLSDVIVSSLMNIKIANNRPALKLFFFLLAAFLVSTIAGCFSAIFIFIVLSRSMIQKLELDENAKLRYAILAFLPPAIALGEIYMPFKAGVLVATNVINSFSSTTYSPTVWLWVFPLAICSIVLYVILCKYVMRVDLSPLNNLTDLADENVQLSKKQKYFLVSFAVLMVLFLVPNILPKTLAITNLLLALGNSGITIVYVFLMAIITIDGEPLLDIRKVSRNVQWDIIFMMAYFMPILSLLANNSLGILGTLNQVLSPILNGLSPIQFAIIIGILTAVLTNFMNNMAIANLFSLIAGAFAASISGLNICATIILIWLLANVVMILPSAAPVVLILFGNKDLLVPSQYIKFALITVTIVGLFICIPGYFYFSLIV